MAKVPTRSPTHESIDPQRLSRMGLDLEDIADDGVVPLAALVELAEDRGRAPSQFIAALALATELKLPEGPAGAPRVTVCVGNCQQWGALDLVEHLLAHGHGAALGTSSCLDQCDKAPACRVDSPAGTLVLAPATAPHLDEALAALRG